MSEDKTSSDERTSSAEEASPEVTSPSAANPTTTITSAPTVMKVTVTPPSNSVILTAKGGTSILKTNQTPGANAASDANPPRKKSRIINLRTLFNAKENENVGFKGESLQQISTNSLPSFVPSSPPNFIKTDRTNYEYHCCTDCGDTFAVKSSFHFHLERRSVLIKFPCETCKNVQIFYNRCTLLSHIRSHTDKSETADITKAIVCPLPRIFMDGLHAEAAANSIEEEALAMGYSGGTPPTALLEFSLKEVDNGTPSPTLEPSKENEKNGVKKVKCLDCNEEFDSPEDRSKHLTLNEKIPDVVSHQCTKCNMICPSKCFLKAHQRIHLQVSPYVCPECGESPSPIWLNFQIHVKFKCFHNARAVGYKCPVCKRLCTTNTSLLKHMELHSEKYFKCDSCSSAYVSTAAFNSHIEENHVGYKVKPKYHMIYKCALCDIVFVNNDQMVSHRSSHLKEQRCEYVFNCMQCGKPLESKMQLNDHIKTSHPKIYKSVVESACKAQETSKQPEPAAVVYRGKIECMLCNLTFHSNQGYIVHVAKAHFNANQPCTYCYLVLPNRKEMIAHGKKHLNKGCFLCLLCNNKKWNDVKQLNSHLFRHASKLQYCTFCPICSTILKQPTEVLAHLKEEHLLFADFPTDAKLLNVPRNTETVTCHFCRDSFGSETELQDHLEANHRVDSLKQSSLASSENKSNEAAPEKKQRLEGNVCAKCNYHSSDREDFKKHILSHKTNKLSMQCQECGLCFVVEPTLSKHLRIVHKISNPSKYITDEGTNYMPDVESQTAVSSCNSSLCSVCFTTFPNETALKTHMRSHGMAFIQSAKSSTSA